MTPSHDVRFVSLAASCLGKVDKATGAITVIDPPTPNAGTRRVWSDSAGRLWVSYWNAGMVAVYDPATDAWRERDLPGGGNQAYSAYVDELDAVWLTDFGQNAIVRFDPVTETFESFASNRGERRGPPDAGQAGRGVGSGVGRRPLVVVRYAPG